MYGFHLNGGDLGIVGTVQYFTIFCASPLPNLEPADEKPAEPKICGCILAVQILQYQPPRDPAQLRQLEQLLRRGGGPPS